MIQTIKEYRNQFATIWEKNAKVVDGQPAVLKYLYKYPAESIKNYNYRKKSSSFHNLPDTILNRWSQIFNKGKISTDIPPELKPISVNIDGKGSTTADYAGELFVQNALYGVTFQVADLPEWDSTDKSEADRMEAGIYPYMSLFTQPTVMNWSFDRSGKPNLLIVDSGNTWTVDNEEYTVYYKYIKGWRIEYIETGKKDQEQIILDEVPILFNGKPAMPVVIEGIAKYNSAPDYFKSPMNAIVDVAVELYNRASANGNAYDKVGFQFLAKGIGTDISQLGMTTMVSVAEADIAPFWVSPDSTNFEQYRKELDRLTKSIFELAGMKDRSLTSDSAKSGVAMQMEDAQSENKVQLIAGTVERTLNKTWQMLALANGTPTAVVDISFPESYDVDALDDELKTLKAIFDLKNNAFYLVMFASFVRRKINDKKTQDKIIAEAEKSTGLRMDTLPNNDVMVTAMNIGAIDPVGLARELNPELKEKTDEEVTKFITENLRSLAEIKDIYGIQDETPKPPKTDYQAR